MAPAPFPLAELSDLVEACGEFGCALTVHEINNPTPAKVQQVYEAWMLKLLEINLEDCIKAAKDQLDQMDHYEIHQDALYIGVFYHTFSQLLHLAQIHDFTISDLTQPTHQRFLHVLSGLLNFYDFEAEQRAETLLPLIEENADLLTREEELVKDIEEKRQRIEEEKAKRARTAPLLATYREQEKAGNLECVAMMESAEELHKKNLEAKERLKELNAGNAQSSLDLKNLSLEINRYKSQLVQSPERLKSSITEMQISLARESEELKALEGKERGMESKVKGLGRYEGELQTCIHLLTEWELDTTKLAEGKARHAQLGETLERLGAERTEMEGEIALLSRRLTNARDEISRFDAKTDLKRAAGKARKKALEEQMTVLTEKKRGLEMKAAEKGKEVIEVEAAIRQIHATAHAELDRGETAFKRIKDQVEVYSLKINKALDSINTLNAQPMEIA